MASAISSVRKKKRLNPRAYLADYRFALNRASIQGSQQSQYLSRRFSFLDNIPSRDVACRLDPAVDEQRPSGNSQKDRLPSCPHTIAPADVAKGLNNLYCLPDCRWGYVTKKRTTIIDFIFFFPHTESLPFLGTSRSLPGAHLAFRTRGLGWHSRTVSALL